jgi:putative acetyltransferase
MGLAPLAVAPSHQGRGIGSALVRAGLEACARAGAGAVVVLGEPQYYARFGFGAAAPLGIRSEYEVPEDAFMVVELVPTYLRAVRGTVVYHPVFADV